MTGPQDRGSRAPARRRIGAWLLALFAAHGGVFALAGPARAGDSAASPTRSLVPRFEAPEGCRNATLLDFPAAGFPRVLPLTHFCPFEPRTDCVGEAVPSRSRLVLKEKPTDPSRDRFKWKLRKGEATTAADLGDPTQDTDYELCMYVEVADVCWLVLHPDALAGSGWKKRKNGFAFKSKGGAHPEGIKKLRIRTGAAGKSRVIMKGKGAPLDLEALPMPPGASILVQLYNGADRCWSTEFGADALVDTDRRYKDASDP